MMSLATTRLGLKHSFQLQILFAGDNFYCEFENWKIENPRYDFLLKSQWKCPEVKKTEIRKRENQDIFIDFSIENRISNFRFSNFQTHRKSCLQQKVFGVGTCASNPVMLGVGTTFPVVFMAVASPEAAPASLRAEEKTVCSVTNPCILWHAFVNPIICL